MSDPAAGSHAVFAAHFPEVAARLAEPRALDSAIVFADGAAIDIRVDHKQLYGGDGAAFAKAQVEAFLAKPLRLYMNRLTTSGLVSPVCQRLVRTFDAHLHEVGQGEIAAYPIGSPTYLVVFGLGLGHHLNALAEATEARWLILAEPIVDFFRHACHVVDWQALIARFERRGGGVHIVTELDPSRMTQAIVRVMTEHGVPYADGSWVFTHYPHWAFAETRKRLHEALEFSFINRGFFEDELVMMENAVTNFARRDFRLLEAKPRLRRPETAVIVGAGPSLDEGIEALCRIRDKVVLFSCGTALRPLLRHGIVPDFHCELENVPQVVDALEAARAYGDLAQITLIATATVDARVPPLFGETVFYFRDSVSSTRILGGRHRIITGASPTCVNMGLGMAVHLGFTEFVFFGTDCGARPGAGRHAAGTVYRDIGMFQASDRDRGNPIEVEGNFGGIVRTDWVYDACRIMLAGMIAHHRLAVVNCSDGALIPGAKPLVPESLELAGPAIDRRELHAALRRSLTPYTAGEILADADFAAIRAAFADLLAGVGDILDDLAAGPADFAAAFERMQRFVDETGDRYAHTDAIIFGTLRALPRIAMFYGYRVPRGPLRDALWALFLAEFRAVLTDIAARTDRLFDRLAAMVPPAACSGRSVRPGG